jgi:hypothetical protein
MGEQSRLQPGMVWPVLVDLATDDGIVTIGAHNVIWIKPHRNEPDRLTAIKTRGSEQSIAIIGLPVDEVRTAIATALQGATQALAQNIATAICAQTVRVQQGNQS